MSTDPDTTEWTVRDPQMLGRAISSYRQSAGVDQKSLAEAANIHRSYLSDLERGKATEQTERLFRVLRRLGVEVVLRKRQVG